MTTTTGFLDALPPQDLDRARDALAPLREELRGCRIFVTGGTGFFGAWMTRSFLHLRDAFGLGGELVLLARDPDAARRENPDLAGHPAIAFHRGDMTGFAFPEGPFTHCLHMATQGFEPATPANAIRKVRVNVAGTERALEFAARSGVKKLLYTSSGAVYGPQPPQVSHLEEDHPQADAPADPRQAYAVEKRCGEFLCAQWGAANGFEAKIARCFAFVGPKLPLQSNYAVGNFIGDVLAGRTVTVAGDGTPCRSYLHASDLAVWLWTILLRGAHGRAYNVGAEEALDIASLARLVARLGGRENDVVVLKSPGGGPPQRYVPSTRRAREELGLRVGVPLDAAIEGALAWHRNKGTSKG